MTAVAAAPPVRLGTRSSRLARWQTSRIAALLRERHAGLLCTEFPIVTEGDRVLDTPLPELGGRGVFTAEIERALLAGEIDVAVHSLKDLPVEPTPGIVTAAVCLRADARDVLISRGALGLAALPAGARVGTCSTRRSAQLRLARPDLVPVPLRGNVDTRIRKVDDGEYDAIILAAAGVERLGLAGAITEYLPLATFLPAPGQGALAVQCRSGDERIRTIAGAIDDARVRAAVTAERAFLHALGGGCTAPVAAHAWVSSEGAAATVRLTALVAAPDGSRRISVAGHAPASAGEALGRRLAGEAVAAGAAELLR